MQIRQLLAVPHSQNADISFHLYEIKTYYTTFWLVSEVLILHEKDRIFVRETVLAYFDNREKAIAYIQLKRRNSYMKPENVEALHYGMLGDD
jgi:predicted transcriptional regulator